MEFIYTIFALDLIILAIVTATFIIFYRVSKKANVKVTEHYVNTIHKLVAMQNESQRRYRKFLKRLKKLDRKCQAQSDLPTQDTDDDNIDALLKEIDDINNGKEPKQTTKKKVSPKIL